MPAGHDKFRAMSSPALFDVPARTSPVRLPAAWRWEPVVLAVAVAAGALALLLTWRADFLAHPAWVAAQKADFILGPIAAGLYWRHRRPANRFGPLLIALGLLGIPFALESASSAWLFTLGALSEYAIFPMTLAVILAFPSGRLDGAAERLILGFAVVGASLPALVWLFTGPELTPSLSTCRAACPSDPLYLGSTPSWMSLSVDGARAAAIVADVATAGLLVRRFLTGMPPRRRALAIGAPIALLFLLTHATYQALQAGATLQWTMVASASAIWIGFLLALIAAEVFAGGALRRLVGESLERPSLRAIERMVREQLGDPRLTLAFYRPDGATEARPRPGQLLTEVVKAGRPAVAIVHDRQLAHDPELLQAAGAVALDALQHAERETAWKTSLRELTDSRARLFAAADRERRRLERELHDGAQQRLMGIQIKLRLTQQRLEDEQVASQLEAIAAEAGQSVEELRLLAHGLYPQALRDFGLADALRGFAMTAARVPVELNDEGIGRCAGTVEAAIYFCVTEGVKGAGGRVTIALGRDQTRVRFAITGDGLGRPDGLTGMRDHVGAVGGELEIVSGPGRRTIVRGSVPLDTSEPVADEGEDAP